MKTPAKRIFVNVTAEHIKFGTRRDCSLCPIAFALQDIDKNAFVSVGPFGASFGLYRYNLTKKLEILSEISIMVLMSNQLKGI